MRAAFYAPLKPPDHPVPSGDRRMACAFRDLLASLGYEVELASRLRSFDRGGNRARQERVGALGLRLAGRLVARYRRRPASLRPALWLTYHLHHKAPDWLGPIVTKALRIPYIVAEASLAPRQAKGLWAFGYEASRDAIGAADLVLAVTRKDLAGLTHELDVGARVRHFPPFLDTAPFVAAASRRDGARARLAEAWHLDPEQPWLLAVAMMRDDVKRLSYELLAVSLRQIAFRQWSLILVGDGTARSQVEACFASLGVERVRFLGALEPQALAEIYAAADLYVWPACGEAYGMALLEAQAAGLPVVAGAEGGVADVVAHGETGILVEPRQERAFAAAVSSLLAQPAWRRGLGQSAQARAIAVHDVGAARVRLARELALLPTAPAARSIDCTSA